PALEDTRRHVAVADRPEQDRVDMPQFLEHRVRQCLAGAEVALPAEIVGKRLHAEPVRDGPEHLQGLRDHLGAGPVPRDDGDAVARRHQSILQSAWIGSFSGTATRTSPSPSAIWRLTHGMSPPASRIPRMNSGIAVASYDVPRVRFSTRPPSRSTRNRSPGC